MPAKKTAEKRTDYVQKTIDAFLKRLTDGVGLNDMEASLLAVLLQTVDNETLRATIGDRLDGWQRRLEDMERHIQSRAALQQTVSGQRGPPQHGPPNLNPMMDGNNRR